MPTDSRCFHRILIVGPAGRLWSVFTSPGAYGVVAVVLVAWVVAGQFLLRTWTTADYWEHLAAIGAFARHPGAPINPYGGPEVPIHLFTPYHLFWGLLGWLTSLPVLYLTPLIALVNVVLLLAAARAVADTFVGERSLVLPVLLAMLFLWLDPPRWSGFYNSGLLPVTAVYPYRLAFPAGLLLATWFCRRQRLSWRVTFIAGIAAAGVFLVHPITGSFVYLLLGLHLLFSPAHSFGARIERIALLAVTGVMATAWPYFPVAAAVLSVSEYGRLAFSGDYGLFYGDAVPGLLLLLALALPSWLHILNTRETSVVSTGMLAVGLLYVVNYVTFHSGVLGRYLIFVVFFLQLHAVRSLVSLPDGWLRPLWRISFAVVLLWLAVPQVRSAAAQVVWYPLETSDAQVPTGLFDGTNFSMVERVADLRRFLGEDRVLLAEKQESWVLPALTGVRVVAVAHASPFLNDYRERLQVVERFFAGEMTEEETAELLAGYQVSAVLVRLEDALLCDKLPADWKPAWTGGGYRLCVAPQDGL